MSDLRKGEAVTGGGVGREILGLRFSSGTDIAVSVERKAFLSDLMIPLQRSESMPLTISILENSQMSVAAWSKATGDFVLAKVRVSGDISGLLLVS